MFAETPVILVDREVFGSNRVIGITNSTTGQLVLRVRARLKKWRGIRLVFYRISFSGPSGFVRRRPMVHEGSVLLHAVVARVSKSPLAGVDYCVASGISMPRRVAPPERHVIGSDLRETLW